jgi:hypothetical protein
MVTNANRLAANRDAEGRREIAKARRMAATIVVGSLVLALAVIAGVASL